MCASSGDNGEWVFVGERLAAMDVSYLKHCGL